MKQQKFVIQQKQFWRQVGLVFVLFTICLFLTFQWLKRYTRHGQHLELPDYTGELLEDATRDAKARSFRLVVLDSLYVVGRRGHEIIRQDPPPFARVKERRTIYVTVTRSSAEMIPISRFPPLYGKSYERKKQEIESVFQVRCEILGRQYDSGEPDHILAVVYEGDTIIDRHKQRDEAMIEKGGKLGFILSQRTGGLLPIPDLICMTYAEAQFLLENSGIQITEIIQSDQIIDLESAYISGQVPDAAEGMIEQGSGMRISLTREKPLGCE